MDDLETNVCVIKNRVLLIARDLSDFMMCLLVPFLLICVQAYRIGITLDSSSRQPGRSINSRRRLRNAVSKLAMIPFSFSIFILPSFLSTFVNNLAAYGLFTWTERRGEILAKYFFALSILLIQLRFSFLFFIISYYDKNLRNTLFKKNSDPRYSLSRQSKKLLR